MSVSPPYILSPLRYTAPLPLKGGVADSVEDLQPDVVVPLGDLRPRAKNVQKILDAVEDIRFCERIFGEWMTQLDKVPSDSKKQDRREKSLRLYLGRLTNLATLCSNETDEILQYQVQFASLMALGIYEASKSQCNMSAGPEGTRLAKDINKASRFLSTNVENMTYELDSLVSTLERVQVTVEKESTLETTPVTVETEPSLAGRIVQWVKSLFQAIAMVFATLTRPISRIVRHHSDPNVQGSALADTALQQGASDICRVESEPKKGKESNSLDSVILFLKEIVPNEARNAQNKLKQSDDALKIMERMSAGQQVALCGPGAAAVAEEWCDVALQYRSALDQKKLRS